MSAFQFKYLVGESVRIISLNCNGKIKHRFLDGDKEKYRIVVVDNETGPDETVKEVSDLTTPREESVKPHQVDSTSDERTTNNTMRHKYRVLTEAEKQQMQLVKDVGEHFLNVIDSCGSSREVSIAKTKTEEAVMWACKHITS